MDCRRTPASTCSQVRRTRSTVSSAGRIAWTWRSRIAFRRREDGMIDIRDELIARIASLAEIPAASVKQDVPLRDQGVDSLMAMELVAFIEKRLGIEIPEEDIPKVRTLNDILDKVRQYAGER